MKIAVDLGGTQVRVAQVKDSVIKKVVSQPCKADGTEQEVIAQLTGMIRELWDTSVTGIGIGVPSVVDFKEGIVYNVIGIPAWKEVHLKDILSREFGVDVAVNNDCNCFALGVTGFGNGKGYSDVVCVTLGTGVGGSLVVGGKIYNGHNTGAGEIGSIPYLDKDYEFYCSSRFFTSHGTTGKEASMRASMGDEEALSIWKEFGSHIGNLVKMIMFAYDPEAIILGGSISKAFPLFEDSMRESLSTFPYRRSVERLKILCSDIEEVALLGASLLV